MQQHVLNAAAVPTARAHTAAGLGAGSETATWDLKVLDTKTGEVLLAVHHRAISLTAMSNIQDKMGKWADKFSTFVATQAIN